MALLAWMLVGLAGPLAKAADLNVLIVGTTYDTGEYGTNTYGTSKAYDIDKVRAELQTILNAAGMGTAQVTLHDFADNSSTLGSGNKLIEEFIGNNTAYPPTSADFWTLLRGEGTHPDWDVVILMGEPYTIEYFPGLYTLGASQIAKEVAKGGAETVLFVGWPAAGSDSTVEHYKEVVYRTGRSMGCKVVPAGLAWQSQGGTHGASHPTNDGAFLAAAAIYSRVWGVEGQDRSVSEFTNGNDALADAAHNVVKANKGAVQYTGVFTHPSDVFTRMQNRDREWSIGGRSSSTENTLRGHTRYVATQAGMDLPAGNVETSITGLHISRGDTYENSFPLNTGFDHPGSAGYYPYNEVIYSNKINYDLGSKLRGSRYLLDVCPTFRHLPHPALWGMVYKGLPSTPLYESQHGGRGWGMSAGSYLLTLKSGRCAMIPDLAEPTVESNAIQVGYETAWAMTMLQGRAPGFKVMPSNYRRHAVDPLGPETMTVRFMFQPTHDVTVNIATDQTWALVSPAQLTFTPENYNTPQEVTVSLAPEAESLRGEYFNVNYSTTSSDEVCHDLSDAWLYIVNTLPIADSKSESVQAGSELVVQMTSTDPDINSITIYKPGFEVPKQIMSYQIVEGPNHGVAVVDGDFITYTPNAGYAGNEQIVYRVNDGLADCVEDAVIDISVLASGQYDLNLLINPGAEFMMQGWSGVGDAWNLATRGGLLNNQPAVSGDHAFRPDRVAENGIPADLYQDVDLSDYSEAIDANLQSFRLSGYGNDKAEDDARFVLEFRDSSGVVIGTPWVSERVNSAYWKFVETTQLAPPGAVTARFIIRGTHADRRNDCYFDELSLSAVRPSNRAPVAVDPPQLSIAQNVPTVIPLEATDLDRFPADTLTYEIVSNPSHGQITGWQDGMPIYTPSQDYLGTDSFTFRVNDGTVYSENTATASILVRANEAPSIVVHTPVMPEDTNTIYMAATNGLIFETSITDDGGPYPTNFNIQWEQTSGPATAVFGNPNSEVTTCDWGGGNSGTDGTYGFRVTASDGQYDTVVNFTVTVLNGGYEIEPNVAPQVEVGGPYSTAIAGTPMFLNGSSLSDDGEPLDPGVTMVQWLQISGPGTAEFSSPDQYETDVVFDMAGTYVLRLTGDDGQVKSYEDVAIEVVLPAPPSVNAGNNVDIYYDPASGSDLVAEGLFYQYDATNNPDDSKWASTTSNIFDWAFGSAQTALDVDDARYFGLSKAYVFPAAKSTAVSLRNTISNTASGTWEFVLDVDADDGLILESGGTGDGFQFWVEGGMIKGQVRSGTPQATVSYALSEQDKSGFIHVCYVIDNDADTFTLYIDGVERDSQPWTGTDWCGSNGSGLGTPNGSPTGFNVDFTGKIAQIRYYSDKAFTPGEVTQNVNSLKPGASVSLQGQVTEGAIASPAITWSVEVGDAAQVNLVDANAAMTEVTFSQLGTYVLKLTVNDGYSEVSDTVTIRVLDPDPDASAYSTWVTEGTFANPFTDTAMNANQDGDLRSNMMEFAFGTDPTLVDLGSMATDGSRHGDPVPEMSDGGVMELYFIRRIDHGLSGSLSYTACFSSDLETFYDNAVAPTVVAASNVNADYEVVKVAFPATLPNGHQANFGYVRVEVVP